MTEKPRPSREDIARRFPLVARNRPCCHPLDVRVRQAADLADTATDNGPDQAVTAAAQALNFAALIASDCGLPDLAHDLCRHQFSLFHTHWPCDTATAQFTLEPLINLGRLHTRNGNGTTAHALIDRLFHAVRDQTTATLDGIAVNFHNLTRTSDDHRQVVQWLRTAVLSDGTRALAHAGRWPEALQHLRDHQGIGHRLLDGRQIAIIAHHVLGDTRTAADLLDQTPTPTPWETAVACTLRALIGRHVPNTSLVDTYLALDDAPPQVVFRTRLALTIHDLTDNQPDPRLTAAIHTDILRTKDAYAARDILAHPTYAPVIPPPTHATLSRVIESSGLGRRTIPPELLNQLTATTTAAQASLTRALTTLTRR